MFYTPVGANRYFEKHIKYDVIERDRNDLRKMVDAFERRIRGWYIEPIEVLFTHPDPGHFSFAVTAMTCLLIDAFSQFRYGELSSEGKVFERFVEDCLPTYAGPIVVRLSHFDHKFSKCGKVVTKYSEILWRGYRCGILHQAHAPLYCGINPGKDPPIIEPVDHAKYGSSTTGALPGTDCPVVVIHPEHLFAEVMNSFQGYLTNLNDADTRHDWLRANFKKKFTDCFGIDVTNATL